MCKSLNEIDEEILAILGPENIEYNVSVVFPCEYP